MSYMPPNSGRQNVPKNPNLQNNPYKTGLSLKDLVQGIKQINVSHKNASPVFREQILINLLLGYINNPSLNQIIWQEGFGDSFSDFARMSIGQKPLNQKE